MNWPYAYTPYIWPMLAISALLLVLGVYAWRRRTVPAALPFLLLVLAWVLWALGSALELTAVDLQTKWFWFQFQAAFKVVTVTCGLIFVLAYAGLDKWLTRTTLTLLASPCVIISGLIVTNPGHQLGWTAVSFGQHVVATNGPIAWAAVLYAALLFLVQVVVLVWLWFQAPLFRWPIALMVGAQTIGRAAFVVEALGVNPVAPLDEGLLFSIPIVLVYFVALFRFRFFDVVPIGRETAIERMVDGLLILDAESRIIDLNPAAGKVLALPRRSIIGHSAREVFSALPDLLQLLEQGTAAQAEIQLKGASGDRCFQVHISPLIHPSGFQLGRLVQLQDVTETQRARARLKEQERALAGLQERERLARELHDSIGQVLGYVSMQVAGVRKLLEDQKQEEADQQLDRLANIAQDAHADVRDYILGLRSGPSRGQAFPVTLHHYLEGFERNFSLHVELAGAGEADGWHLPPEVESQLFRIVQEALTNARKHSAARCIRVTLATEGGQARITVQDDGRGFDPAKIPNEAGGFGLRFMCERAEQVAGRVELISRPGMGTQVVVQIPLSERAEITQ